MTRFKKDCKANLIARLDSGESKINTLEGTGRFRLGFFHLPVPVVPAFDSLDWLLTEEFKEQPLKDMKKAMPEKEWKKSVLGSFEEN